jgi:hypothetical protein
LLLEVDKEPRAPKEGDAYHQILVSVDADGRNREELHDNEARYISQGRKGAEDLITCAEWR